ncbi:MAG TPA: hypothetical protein GX714_03745 [Chloroflexi bacterium]|jgi:hypothetical protein|nr:hypothetical protein [Chloroflexota bacterium]
MMTPDGRGEMSDDAALNALLATWAARHALSDEQLKTVRHALGREVEGAASVALCEAILPLEWWERFFADLQVGMRRAVSLVGATRRALTAGSAQRRRTVLYRTVRRFCVEIEGGARHR